VGGVLASGVRGGAGRVEAEVGEGAGGRGLRSRAASSSACLARSSAYNGPEPPCPWWEVTVKRWAVGKGYAKKEAKNIILGEIGGTKGKN